MRISQALIVLVATSAAAAVGGVDAADETQVCTSADYADGTCAEPETDGAEDDDQEEWSSDDDDSGEDLSFECVDKDDRCDSWAAEGGCDDNPGYMTHNCAESCDTCDAVVAARKAAEFADEKHFRKPCMDDDFRCLEWAGQGECDANPGYMKRSCRNACLVCYEGSNQFGIGQRIPSKREAGDTDVVGAIQKSMEYMRTVWADKEYVSVRHKCKNQHEDCTYWAAIGECDANPKYMRTNCAPACETCDLLDIKHRCPVEPDNQCIWKPGDLNTLMENIVDDADGSGEYTRFNPQALSRPKLKRDGSAAEGVEKNGPWVVLLEGFVSSEEADRLVELGGQKGYERSADVGKEKPDGTHDSLVSESRTSHNTWCQEKECYEDPIVAPVIERIANVTKTEVKNSEYLQLLQYEPGQYYRQHHDYIPHHLGMPCGVRILTLFIYLSDVEEGGGTSFPFLDITVMPKKGNAVLWPSVLDEAPEKKDGRTEHEALPVEKGLKYGANAWIHSRDFKAAFEKNCH